MTGWCPLPLTVADREFPRGRRKPIIWPKFTEKYMKRKKTAPGAQGYTM